MGCIAALVILYHFQHPGYPDKYGGFTIAIARFVPFIRTFPPFPAGVGKMNY
jgi:hypothetical protein